MNEEYRDFVNWLQRETERVHQSEFGDVECINPDNAYEKRQERGVAQESEDKGLKAEIESANVEKMATELFGGVEIVAQEAVFFKPKAKEISK